MRPTQITGLAPVWASTEYTVYRRGTLLVGFRCWRTSVVRLGVNQPNTCTVAGNEWLSRRLRCMHICMLHVKKNTVLRRLMSV